MNDIGDAAFEHIFDFINVTIEASATEIAAAFLEYRSEHFPENIGAGSLLLDLTAK